MEDAGKLSWFWPKPRASIRAPGALPFWLNWIKRLTTDQKNGGSSPSGGTMRQISIGFHSTPEAIYYQTFIGPGVEAAHYEIRQYDDGIGIISSFWKRGSIQKDIATLSPGSSTIVEDKNFIRLNNWIMIGE